MTVNFRRMIWASSSPALEVVLKSRKLNVKLAELLSNRAPFGRDIIFV